MKNLYFLDEEEKNRILNIHESATKRQYLSEQPEYVMPQTTTTSTKTLSADEQIAKQFYNAASGPGTNADEMVNAINKITSAEQFWKVNNFVKSRPNNGGKLDIAGVINDEFEYYGDSSNSNIKDLDKIIAKLTKLGITFTITKNKKGHYVNNTFKITSQPIVTAATNTLNPAALSCIKQFGDDVKISATPGFVYLELTDGSTLFFGVDYSIQHQTEGKPTIYGNWSCKSNVLNIIRKDGLTWSKAQGGWKNSTDTQVVDPNKGQQTKGQQIRQKTTDITKEVQKALGVQTPNGTLDSASLDNLIGLLKQPTQ
jgi:hypothetical protein